MHTPNRVYYRGYIGKIEREYTEKGVDPFYVKEVCANKEKEEEENGNRDN